MVKVKRHFLILNQDKNKVAKFSCNTQAEVWRRYNKRAKELLGEDAESVCDNNFYGNMYWEKNGTYLYLEEVKLENNN